MDWEKELTELKSGDKIRITNIYCPGQSPEYCEEQEELHLNKIYTISMPTPIPDKYGGYYTVKEPVIYGFYRQEFEKVN